ncbi:MAG TPA: iron chelate uptake ABC transporter family permease subunit [Cytophagaceae bacterium]|nr:iron chelate uptake ABC transporter family permease subunit [Cytophagaceae bacterium]
MKHLINFITLSDPNTRYVVLGVMLMSIGTAVLGCFTFLRKKALIGDAIAHSVLPGVCLAFILSGEKNPLLLILGAFATGWLSVLSVDFIKKYSKLKEDAAIGLVLSVFFGVGILLLTYIQHSGNAAQSGLDSFIFGKAASLVSADVYIFGSVAIVLVLIVFLLYKEFMLIAFDEHYAVSIGFPVRLLEVLLTTLTVLSVVVGIQAIGVVLMAAMLITPAAAARFWTNKLPYMLLVASLFGVIAGVGGAYVSYNTSGMPTGPWIVLFVSMIAILSFMFAPQRGLVYRWYSRRVHRSRIMEENILKAFYQLGEQDENFFRERSVSELSQKRGYAESVLTKWFSTLIRHGYLRMENGKYILTEEGRLKGQRITKLHRLWEMYLTEYVNLAPDHVHDDAENIEHIITPEIEKKLEEQLQYPDKDPHDSRIPYSKL